MRSVQRIIAIFESFSVERKYLSLQEISNQIELPKSTTFRLVQSLEQAGYIVRLENMSYCLSFRFSRLAGHVPGTIGIREIARPAMTELAEATGETVSIHTASDMERVCLDSVTGDSPLRSVVQPGEHFPLRSGSAAKVLVAFMPEHERMTLIPVIAKELRKSASEIRAELAKIKSQGYAISNGERLAGVTAISAPIFDIDDKVGFCLSIGGPGFRMESKQEELIRRAKDTARIISNQFGGHADLMFDAVSDDDSD